MSVEPCEKHEVSNCGLCKQQRPAQRSSVTHLGGTGRFRTGRDMRVVEAQFEGFCGECAGRIDIGDLIVSDDGVWNHKVCP